MPEPMNAISVTIDGRTYEATGVTWRDVTPAPAPPPPAPVWQPLKAGRADSTALRWGFDAIDLSSAGATVTRSLTTPTSIICRCDGRDGANGRARLMFAPRPWSHPWLGTTFNLCLMAGWHDAIPQGGSAQIWKADCWPTQNNSIALLYRQQPNTWQLVVKDAGVDTNVGPEFAIPENVWTTLDLRLLLKSDASGAAEVRRDGELVSETRGAKTLYRVSGNPITYLRWGLAAHGPGQVFGTRVDLDAVTLYGAME